MIGGPAGTLSGSRPARGRGPVDEPLPARCWPWLRHALRPAAARRWRRRDKAGGINALAADEDETRERAVPCTPPGSRR